MASPSKPKAILFDWDNTLVSSWGSIHLALEQAFLAMGQTPWTLEECKARVRTSAREAFPVLFGERAPEATEVFYRAYEALHLEGVKPLSGAEELLAGLGPSGQFVSVVSNKTNYLLRREVEHLGWGGYFDSVVGALDAEKDKPAPDPVHLALAGSGLEPGPDVWFVGDTDIDLMTAAATGCIPVLVRAQTAMPGEFPGHEPALQFPSLAELKPLLI